MTISGVLPISSGTTRMAWPPSWTRASRSTSTSSWPATWASGSSTCSRRTTTPTTSRATAGSPRRPARRSTSTARRGRNTTMSRSTTAPSSSSARCVVRALHTPGHRPEHTAFALIDTRRGDEPWAVLTGDTLFVNDVARPDLAIEKSDGARGIFRVLERQAARARRRRRGLARPPRRLDVRRPGHGHEDVVDDRLREAPQPDAGDRRRGRVRAKRRWPGSARSRRTSRRSSSSTAARCSPTASS